MADDVTFIHDVALIDIDKVTLSSEKRARMSATRAAYVIQELHDYLSKEEIEAIRKKVFYHKKTFYAPEWMRKDTPMPGAENDLNQIERRYWIYFYTSRMEDRREATEQTLRQHRLLTPRREVLMKPMDFERTPTLNYKVGLVPFIARLLKPKRILLVDDEEHIRKGVLDISQWQPYEIAVYASLADACNQEFEYEEKRNG